MRKLYCLLRQYLVYATASQLSLTCWPLDQRRG